MVWVWPSKENPGDCSRQISERFHLEALPGGLLDRGAAAGIEDGAVGAIQHVGHQRLTAVLIPDQRHEQSEGALLDWKARACSDHSRSYPAAAK